MSLFKQKAVIIKDKVFKLPKWLLITIVITLILAIAFGAYLFFGRDKSRSASGQVNTFTVTRQTIQHTVTGSGSIEPNDQYEITPLVKGEILSAHFEEGDMVEKGDVMYVIDSSDQESTMKRAQNSLKQAQSSYNDAVDNFNNLTIKSPIGGTVTAVYVEEGDNVNTNTKIMDVVNDEYMILSIPFIAQDAKKLYAGQSATVYIEGNNYTLDGTVTYVTSGSTLNSEGVQVSNVEIKVKNPGALEAGDKATAIVGSVACNSAGTFKTSQTISILAESSGEIASLICRAGDNVQKGEILAKIESTSTVKQVENAELSLESAQISYENTLDQLEDYTITAPISGTVIQKNSKAGDTLDSSTSQVSMAVIADMSRMTFDISIDELDIQLLEVGQKASITADAFEGQIFTGTVDYISVIGTTSNGVTSYPVTIVLDDAGDLLPGMNVDASIIVSESVDTLVVPVDAVQRNNIVYVKDNGSSNENNQQTQDTKPAGEKMSQKDSNGKTQSDNEKSEQGENQKSNFGMNAPEGFKAVKVELGINNDSFIEILSGLKEGDIVYVQARASSSESIMTGFPGMGGGMPSGMGGGMPTGMPSGGMGTGGGGMMR